MDALGREYRVKATEAYVQVTKAELDFSQAELDKAMADSLLTPLHTQDVQPREPHKQSLLHHPPCTLRLHPKGYQTSLWRPQRLRHWARDQ